MVDRTLTFKNSLIEAIAAIEQSFKRMTVVLSDDGVLLGTLTDGDIRRHLLSNGTLNDSVIKAMNSNPIKAIENSSSGFLIDLMRHGNVNTIPIVDSDNKFIRLTHIIDIDNSLDNFNKSDLRTFSFAVIMAGGQGKRLRPYTERIPKPMIEIAGAPLLESQIRRLVNIGIEIIYISINYLGHLIESYFGNGKKFGIKIIYLKEQIKLGTAGSLSLLPKISNSEILIMNGDILTNSDFTSLFNFHKSLTSKITIAAINYKIQVPYGVIKTSGTFASELIEKPSESFFCNAGIYAISSDVLSLIKPKEYLDMPDFISKCIKTGLPVAVYPIHEYWSDIGTPDDLEKARTFFTQSENIKKIN